jgi:hypothetical protein
MMTYIVGYSGIALVAAVIVLLDYFGQRHRRKTRKTTGSCSPSPHAIDF